MSTYEQTVPTTDRRGFLKLVVGGAVVYVALRALTVPGLGEVITGDHAVARHGLDALRVRKFFVALALTDATFLNRPPCRQDGAFRFTDQLGPNEWCLWVLEKIGPSLFQERTAFVTPNQSYIKAVRDDCDDVDWRGHSYAQGGASGQEGDGIERIA